MSIDSVKEISLENYYAYFEKELWALGGYCFTRDLLPSVEEGNENHLGYVRSVLFVQKNKNEDVYEYDYSIILCCQPVIRKSLQPYEGYLPDRTEESIVLRFLQDTLAELKA